MTARQVIHGIVDPHGHVNNARYIIYLILDLRSFGEMSYYDVANIIHLAVNTRVIWTAMLCPSVDNQRRRAQNAARCNPYLAVLLGGALGGVEADLVQAEALLGDAAEEVDSLVDVTHHADHSRAILPGGSLRTSTRTEIGRAGMTNQVP